jgi:flagellar L-ring protein precursor FlgH
MKMIGVIMVLVFTLSGCNTMSVMEPSKIKKEPFEIGDAFKYSKKGPEVKDGTIWKGDRSFNTYFIDQRAMHIGDIVTIRIVEVSQATEKATTDTGRTSSLEAGIPNFLGQELTPARRAFSNPSQLITSSTKNNFSGSGETTRSGSLSATISTKVVDVLPNGNLAIEGKREIYINNEKKEILLQGLIRQKDIAADNSVLSTQVADAKVMYTGVGVLGEKQRPGWLSRVFDLVWPF